VLNIGKIMKKSLLSTITVLTIACFTITKSAEKSRHESYQILDQAVAQDDWGLIFTILESMQGVIDVNEYTDRTGTSLLHIAVFNKKHLAAKKLLEEYNANSNIKYNGFSFVHRTYPIMTACMKGDLPMINLLLKHGANPHLQDSKGKTAFDFGTNKNIPELLKSYEQ
jgi:hypothetical protein